MPKNNVNWWLQHPEDAPAWWQDPMAGFTPIQTREEYQASKKGSKATVRIGRYSTLSREEQRKKYMSTPQYQQIMAMNRANAMNEERYSEAKGIYDEIISQTEEEAPLTPKQTSALGAYNEAVDLFRPGSGYGEGAMALYQRAKKKAMGGAAQNFMSRGLLGGKGSTLAAGYEKKYEEEVGTPFYLQLNDMRMERLAGALGQVGGAYERFASYTPPHLQRRDMAMMGKAGMIERRDDVQPNMEMYANLTRMSNAGPRGMNFSFGGGGGGRYNFNEQLPQGGGGGGSYWQDYLERLRQRRADRFQERRNRYYS